jgi:hypothetical protein
MSTIQPTEQAHNLGPEDFQCAYCGEVHQKACTDEEAAEEQEANGWADEECVIICDDCYQLMVGATKAN